MIKKGENRNPTVKYLRVVAYKKEILVNILKYEQVDTNFLKIESNLKALEDMWSNLSNWKIYKSDRTWEW